MPAIHWLGSYGLAKLNAYSAISDQNMVIIGDLWAKNTPPCFESSYFSQNSSHFSKCCKNTPQDKES